ncbi:DUF4174 domain-containing protein [Sinisalibacter aestuarii]|uniref:DUF4174 domain-containing protein n=1 Tax=Sinisalibacter aestuarii TaxID=2949426 RepID=A0ABQ5LVG6_9RHOB|nr:DUF4174 domain-containing protein [Sinisalibacter aestuarii]GKY88341.1 hypothetical protein STA1M1_22100 [Sinisalibacter aestuarii]
MFKALAAAAALAASLATPAAAQGAEGAPELVITEAGTQVLGDFLWQSRLLVVFADSPNDPRFIQQMGYIEDRPGDLIERDVIVITDTDPAARSPIREELRPRGFDFVLIGKDGFKYLRKPLPWDVREISRSIDKMPLRQQELRDQRARP